MNQLIKYKKYKEYSSIAQLKGSLGKKNKLKVNLSQFY